MYLQNKIRGCYKHIEHVAFLCGYRRPQPVSSAKFRPRNGPNHFSLLTSPFLVPAAAAQQPSPHNHRFSQMDTATRYKKDQKPLKTSKKTLGTTTYIYNIHISAEWFSLSCRKIAQLFTFYYYMLANHFGPKCWLSGIGCSDFLWEKKLDPFHVVYCFRAPIPKFFFEMLLFSLVQGLVKCWLLY